ncbi:PspA-associated protein PspAA [Vallicoccus soli]|uniref:PspA-associated domain-containing protein n=1 Tax=Vallicoccus soli TaxID=2339232 RepID=A0A3A3Z158_9ACTN|nr:hypothetical protein [Vallicoccus soli]RJK96913.1 hypothetical protein D5H78_06605 [Vallicoccus soli]
MIIRILGDGQYLVPDDAVEQLQALDDALEEAVATDDDDTFRRALTGLLDHVRQAGELLPDEDLDASDAILPGDDAHVDEVRALLLDDGVIPG